MLVTVVSKANKTASKVTGKLGRGYKRKKRKKKEEKERISELDRRLSTTTTWTRRFLPNKAVAVDLRVS